MFFWKRKGLLEELRAAREELEYTKRLLRLAREDNAHWREKIAELRAANDVFEQMQMPLVSGVVSSPCGHQLAFVEFNKGSGV